MKEYRVRRGFLGKCVLQELVDVYHGTDIYTTSTTKQWRDVSYNRAPRTLVSQLSAMEQIKKLEIDLAYTESFVGKK